MSGFTPDELAFGEEHPVLGPTYDTARKAAEAFMAVFEAEHFKPLIDKFADDFRDKLWSDVDTFLLSDTESNLHLTLWRMVEGTINALLTGEAWALERYVLAKGRYGDAAKVRKAIVQHCREQIADQRISELEEELAQCRKDLAWARERY